MISPMIARLVRDPFDGEGWFFELKSDGFRAIAEKNKLGVRLYSRNQHNFKRRFPVIAQAVSALDNVILDAEIVALDEHGHPRFEWSSTEGNKNKLSVSEIQSESLRAELAAERRRRVVSP